MPPENITDPVAPAVPAVPPASLPADPPANPPASGETVPLEEFNKVKNDMHTFKTKLLAKEKEAEDAKFNSLKEKQDWKALAEANETKAKEFEEKYNGLNQSLVQNAKMTRIREAALKAGITKESLDDLEMFDFDEVSVETTSGGKVLVSGADQAIENLKKRRPHWFGAKPASVNPATPGIQTPSTGTVSLQEVEKAEQDHRKSPHDKQLEKIYHEKLMAFKRQN